MELRSKNLWEEQKMSDNEKLLNEIKKMQGGDFSSYEEFYYITSPFVYDILINNVRNKDVADSLTAKVYQEVYQRIGEVTDVDFFYKWIEKITRDAAKEHINSLIPQTIESSGVQNNPGMMVNATKEKTLMPEETGVMQGQETKPVKSVSTSAKIIIGVVVAAILVVVGVVICINIGGKNKANKDDDVTEVASATDSETTEATTEVVTETTESTTEATTEVTTAEPTTEPPSYENLSETERLYYTYISDTLLSQYQLADINYRESSVCDDTLMISDIGRLLKDAEGIISAKIVDLNRDGVEELLIVRTEPAEDISEHIVIMDVYGIIDGTVNLISTEDKLFYRRDEGSVIFTMCAVEYNQYLDISIVNTDEDTFIMLDLNMCSVFTGAESRCVHLYKLADNDIKKVCRYACSDEVNYGWTFAEDETAEYEDFYDAEDLETDKLTPFIAKFGVDMEKYSSDDEYSDDVVSYDIDMVIIDDKLSKYRMTYLVTDFTNLRDYVER